MVGLGVGDGGVCGVGVKFVEEFLVIEDLLGLAHELVLEPIPIFLKFGGELFQGLFCGWVGLLVLDERGEFCGVGFGDDYGL